MSAVQPSNASPTLRQKLAQPFTPFIRFHNPLLDPDLSTDDVSLVPEQLAPKGGLKWALPERTGSSDGECTEPRTDADNFLDGFSARVSDVHESVSHLEDFVIDWVLTSEITALAASWEEAEDQQGRSTTTLRSSICSELDGGEISPHPIIEVTSPILEPDDFELMQETEAAEHSGKTEKAANTPTTTLEHRSLRKKRSFGPYELFWMKNNPYSCQPNWGGRDRRKIFSTINSIENDDWLIKAMALSDELQKQ